VPAVLIPFVNASSKHAYLPGRSVAPATFLFPTTTVPLVCFRSYDAFIETTVNHRSRHLEFEPSPHRIDERETPRQADGPD
jgi:hypothetical protein